MPEKQEILLLDELKKVEWVWEFINKLEEEFNYDNFRNKFANQVQRLLEKDVSEYSVDEVLCFSDEYLNKFINYLIYLELTKEKEEKAEENKQINYKNAQELAKKNAPYNYNKKVKQEKNEKLEKSKNLLKELKESSEKFEEFKTSIDNLNFEEFNDLYMFTKNLIWWGRSDTGFEDIKWLPLNIIKKLYIYTFFNDNILITKQLLKIKLSSKKWLFKVLDLNKNLYQFIRENFNDENIDIFDKYIKWILLDEKVGIKNLYEYYSTLKRYIFNYVNIDDWKEKMTLEEVFKNNDAIKEFRKKAN